MFAKKSNSTALPVQFEGTTGVYAKRESPPKIPSTHSTFAAGSISSLNNNSGRVNLSSTQAVQFSPMICLINLEKNMEFAMPRRQSHTPQRSTRKAAPRHELSSHSFNVPHSSASHQRLANTPQRRHGKPSSMENSQNGQNSSDLQFGKGRLGPAVSFGNFADPVIMPPIALQHVYAGKNLNNQNQNVGESGKLDLDFLPHGWEIRETENGEYRYYVDHNNGRTHWIHPLAPEILKPGWTKIFDSVHGVVYYNRIERRSQFDHPGFPLDTVLNGSILPTIHASSSLHSMEGGAEPDNEDSIGEEEEELNIIHNEDVPEWLKLYSQAPFNSDYLLNFNLFKLNQLEAFDRMIMRLYKQEAINTVIKYDGPISEIDNELLMRM